MRTALFNYKATLLKVIDGDTFDILIDLGFSIQHKIRVRINGIDTPEVSTEKGRLVRDELRALLPVGTSLFVTTFKDPSDKYGRWLASVEVEDVAIFKSMYNVCGTSDIATYLLKTGNAVEYNGGKAANC